jgi:uncharacterized protein
MNIEGEHVFKGPRQDVWEMFYDPNILASALPGTQKLDKVSENEYDGIINLRIGPVSGAFTGKLTVSDENPPESCTLTVDGRGTPGFAKGVGHVHFDDPGDGTTLMKYNGEVQIGGTLASVGQRMLDSVSKSMIRQGFDSLDKALEAKLAAKEAGKAVEYKAPSETGFAAAVTKDMIKTKWASMSSEVRLIVLIVPLIIIVALISLLLSQ